MAYKVIILYQLYMPSYFLGTFTEYPELYKNTVISHSASAYTPSTGDSNLMEIFRIPKICIQA